MYFIWADILSQHYFVVINYKPFSTLNILLSWLIYVYPHTLWCSLWTLWWKLFFCEHPLLWQRGVCQIQWKLSNIWRKVQIADHLALQQNFSLQQQLFLICFVFFFWVNANYLSVWYFYVKWKHRVLWLHTFTSETNVFDFNVIFVTTEVSIFIQRLGLYSGPVTDCTFVGKCIIQISTAESPPASLRSMLIFKLNFLTFAQWFRYPVC